jgi:hypothetical protein
LGTIEFILELLNLLVQSICRQREVRKRRQNEFRHQRLLSNFVYFYYTTNSEDSLNDLSKESLLSLATHGVTEECCETSSQKRSLYTGGLRPHVYLWLQWARRMIQSNDHESQERNDMLEKSKQAAEYALQQSA